MDLGAIIVVGLALFVLYVLFAVWRTECYDESESFLYNLCILAAGIFFMWKIFPAICVGVYAFIRAIF